MNFVFIMTDTQNRDMVGAYGQPWVDTPNLDRLAAQGMRFDRAFTTCPLCTPARSGIFSGTYPTVNGAWCNNVPPYATHPLMGTIFRHHGYRAAYTGKWHLDGGGYFGDGIPGGGFEPDWWYDGACYARDIGPEQFRLYRTARTPADLRAGGFTEETIWGHRVADRAIDFLRRVGDEPFVLAVSFDEPHGPHVAPPEYWEEEALPGRFPPHGTTDGKPRLQQVHAAQARGAHSHARLLACNRYIDREIGRVVDAVDRLHAADTLILYTSDHGDMLGCHGLTAKGPMMYEEIVNVPLIARGPGVAAGTVSRSVVSHLDILPTLLDLAGADVPECLHGRSLRPLLADPLARVREHAMCTFTRFAINHDDWGGFYPIRCLTDGRHKLSLNFLETDELYDLSDDPHEERNRIDDPALASVRDRLHDALLEELDRVRDPFRSFRWGARAWRSVREESYFGGQRRNRPAGFAFEPKSLEASGEWSG